MHAIGNLPDKDPLRWSLNKGARELDTTEYLLAKRLKDCGETADQDGCWSTSQLIKGMFGSVRAEQLRRIRAEADGRELKNSIMRSEFLPRSELERTFAELASAMKQIVRASKLDQPSQDDFLKVLSSIPIQLKAVGDRQRNGRNGDTVPSEKTRPKSKLKSKLTASK
jgi:hypothetical protein